MSLPKRYDKSIKNALAMRAVWLPGSNMPLGTVVQRDEGIFQPVAPLSEFGASFQTQKANDRSLKLSSSGTKSRTFQFGAEVNNLEAMTQKQKLRSTWHSQRNILTL